MKKRLLRILFASFIVLVFVSLSFCSAFCATNDMISVSEISDVYEETTDRSSLSYSCTASRLIDKAGLLDKNEKAEVLSLLNKYSKKLNFDIVVVTVDSLGYKTAEEYADDYYDKNGYGYGEEHDGALLLISMEERDYWISTCGFGIEAIDCNNGVEYIEDEIVSFLSHAAYAEAFKSFAETVKELVEYAVDVDNGIYEEYPSYGEIINDEYNENFSFSPSYASAVSLGTIVLSVVAGFAISLAIVLIMKSKLRTVKHKKNAANYIVPGSFAVERSYERFLYKNVTRTKINNETNNNSGHGIGGSSGGFGSTHVSSSGVSHGGGGGKF